MSSDKHIDSPKKEEGMDTSARARNRTVMLTPDVASEVRQRLANELHDPNQTQQSQGSQMPPFSYIERETEYTTDTQMGSVGTNDNISTVSHGHAKIVGRDPYADFIVWNKPAPIAGFLITYDRDENGEFFELRAGRLIVSSEEVSNGNCLVLRDESVSPMHAIVRISPEGSFQVLDQLSEYGTGITKKGEEDEEVLSGEKAVLRHGDRLRFGNRKFYLCLIERD